MPDLRFLVDKEKAKEVRDEVVRELESWNNTLSTVDENLYYQIIGALNDIINKLS